MSSIYLEISYTPSHIGVLQFKSFFKMSVCIRYNPSHFSISAFIYYLRGLIICYHLSKELQAWKWIKLFIVIKHRIMLLFGKNSHFVCFVFEFIYIIHTWEQMIRPLDMIHDNFEFKREWSESTEMLKHSVGGWSTT